MKSLVLEVERRHAGQVRLVRLVRLVGSFWYEVTARAGSICDAAGFVLRHVILNLNTYLLINPNCTKGSPVATDPRIRYTVHTLLNAKEMRTCCAAVLMPTSVATIRSSWRAYHCSAWLLVGFKKGSAGVRTFRAIPLSVSIMHFIPSDSHIR